MCLQKPKWITISFHLFNWMEVRRIVWTTMRIHSIWNPSRKIKLSWFNFKRRYLRFTVGQLVETFVRLHVERHAALVAPEARLVPCLRPSSKIIINNNSFQGFKSFNSTFLRKFVYKIWIIIFCYNSLGLLMSFFHDFLWLVESMLIASIKHRYWIDKSFVKNATLMSWFHFFKNGIFQGLFFYANRLD